MAKNKWQDWGIVPREGMRHRVNPVECPHCWHRDDKWCYHTVGYSNGEALHDFPSNWDDPVYSVIAIECPHCFKLTWCHMDPGTWYQWLEIPAAKEACENMLDCVKVEQTKKEGGM